MQKTSLEMFLLYAESSTKPPPHSLHLHTSISQKLLGTDAQLKLHYDSVRSLTEQHVFMLISFQKSKRIHKLIIIAQSLNHPTYFGRIV